MDVTSEDMETLARINVPELQGKEKDQQDVRRGKREKVTTDPTSRIITPTNDLIPAHLQTPDRQLMAIQDVQTNALLDVPYSDGFVPRARNGDGTTVEDAHASDGGDVTAEEVEAAAVEGRGGEGEGGGGG